MDPAVTGLQMIYWFQDLLVNHSSRAGQMPASPGPQAPGRHLSPNPATISGLRLGASPTTSPCLGLNPRHALSGPFLGNPPCLQGVVLLFLAAALGFIFTAVQHLRTMPAQSPSSTAMSSLLMSWLTPQLTTVPAPLTAAWQISAGGPPSTPRPTSASGSRSATRSTSASGSVGSPASTCSCSSVGGPADT